MSRIACDRVRAKFGTSLLFQVGRTTVSCVCCDKEDENIVPSLLDRPLIKFQCFGAADRRTSQIVCDIEARLQAVKRLTP